MLISIIIPVYKSVKYIEKCIRSVFEQTYKDLEIIIVDDCGHDGSIDLIKSIMEDYPDIMPKVKFIIHDCNKGCAVARRDGMAAANGDYMLHVDSDDYADDTLVEKLVAKATAEKADMVVCDYYYVYETKKARARVGFTNNNIEFAQRVLLGDIHAGLWNKLIKMSIIKDNSICPVPGINMGDDMTILLPALFSIKKISQVVEPLYYYNRTAEGCISRSSIPIEDDIKLINFIKHTICKSEEQSLSNTFMLFRLGRLGRNLLYNDLKDVKRFVTTFDISDWKLVFEHKRLPVFYKLVIVFYLKHFTAGVLLIRYLIRIKKKLNG